MVDKARAPYKVVNYPEFVNRKPGDTFIMNYDFVELAHINRALIKAIKKKPNAFIMNLKNKIYIFSNRIVRI